MRDELVSSVVEDLLAGLRTGLSDFAGPTKVAAFVAMDRDAPLKTFDPHGLLSATGSSVDQLLGVSWTRKSQSFSKDEPDKTAIAFQQVNTPAAIGCGGYSSAIPFQFWLVEPHPRLANRNVIIHWLEGAITALSYAATSKPTIFAANNLVQHMTHYASEAVRAALISRLPPLSGSDPVSLLQRLSNTYEEQKSSSGTIAFSASTTAELGYLTRINTTNPLSVSNVKQIRKLLSAVAEGFALVCDSEQVIGIARYEQIANLLWAKFKRGRGQLHLGSEFICSIVSGTLKAFSLPPEFVWPEDKFTARVRELLRAARLEGHLRQLVSRVYDRGAGCTIAIDLTDDALSVPGIALSPPLDFVNEDDCTTIALMATVDGALLIDKAARVRKFGCLLDGAAVASENLSRGARYNSALRFSNKHPNSTIVLIVSSDGSISTFFGGVDLTRPS